MQSKLAAVDVTVEELKESAPNAHDDSVVLHTKSLVDGELCDTSIEVRQSNAPQVAVALLNTEALDFSGPPADDLPPAMRCLAAGLVELAGNSEVRMHLQFDSGQVLPVEMSLDAAAALCRGLMARTGLDAAGLVNAP